MCYSYQLNNLKNYTIEDIETTQIMRVRNRLRFIFNNYRSQYSFIGDDGVFVSFGFKDGGNFIAYIPEIFV